MSCSDRRQRGCGRAALALVAGVLATAAHAGPAPLDPSQWPRTPRDAVAAVVAALRPHQASIVRGTPREDLHLLRGEWGEDIETLLGLDRGNTALAAAVCGRPCPPDDAVQRLMEAAWDALRQPPGASAILPAPR